MSAALSRHAESAAIIPVPTPSIVLAFDFGERYLGVAVGNTLTGLAHPADMIEATEVDKRFAAIEALIRDWQPTRLVVPPVCAPARRTFPVAGGPGG